MLINYFIKLRGTTILKKLVSRLIMILFIITLGSFTKTSNSIESLSNDDASLEKVIEYHYYPINNKSIGFWPYLRGYTYPIPDYSRLKELGFSKMVVRWTQHTPDSSLYGQEDLIITCGSPQWWYTYAFSNFPNAGSYEIDEPLERYSTLTNQDIVDWITEVRNRGAEARIGVSYKGQTTFSSRYFQIASSANINYMYSSYYKIPDRWKIFNNKFPNENHSNYINLHQNSSIFRDLLEYADSTLNIDDVVLYGGDTTYTDDDLEAFCYQAYLAGWLGRTPVSD